MDTLRADALGAYGNADVGEDGGPVTPALDAFAAEAVTFERAFATAPWTIPSVASQLSGQWPFDHGANALLQPLGAGLSLVPEQLSAAGWRTAGVTTNFVTRGDYGFGRGFERFDDALAQGHEGATGSAAVGALLESCDALGAGGQDRFLFALLFEPHFRYLAHPGRRFGPGWGSAADEAYDGPLDGSEELAELRARLGAGHTERDSAFLRGLYLSDVARMDAAFAELRAGLEARGLWDGAWVVFTADHGEEFGEAGWIGHTTSLRQGMLHVPWIVKPPAGRGHARRGARIERPVSLVDLPATLLQMAGEDGARAAGGLLPAILGEGEPERRFLYAYTRFEPVLRTAAASAKRSHRLGVIDAERELFYEVDRLAPDEGFRPRLRGLLPESLGPGEDLAERLAPEEFAR